MTAGLSAARGDRDWALALASLLGAAASMWLLLASHRTPPTPPDSAPPIAQVAFVAADVRRRTAGTLVWEDVGAGATVLDGDAIFVPPGAEARIAFADGSELDVDENSLVVLEAPTGRGAAVDLRQGSFTGATGEHGLSIRSEQGVAAIAGRSQVTVEIDGSAGARVAVHEGEARVSAKDGSAVVVRRAQAAVTRGGTVATAAGATVQLLAPERNARIFYRGDAAPPVNLAWSGAPAAARLVVARDRGFGFIVDAAPGGGEGRRFDRTARGVFWWRLVDLEGRPLSESRRFTLVEDVAPMVITPRRGETVLATAEHPLPFAWTAVKGAVRYRLEIASEASFATPVKATTFEGTQLRLDAPWPEGIYHWRVRVDDADRPEAPFARAAVFRLIHKPLLDAPELLTPEIEVEGGR